MLDFHAELHTTNELLKRIADALDRAVPPNLQPVVPRLRGPEALVDLSDEAIAFRTRRDQLLDDQNFTPAERLAARAEFDTLSPQEQRRLLDGR